MEYDFRHDQPTRAGVLVVNLGTPDAPTPAAVRRYLAEFLSDRRVVDLAPVLWRPILHGVILRLRPRRVAEAYRSIWTDEGSPLLVYSQRLARALGESLGDRAPVELGMCYGNPSLETALRRLEGQGVGHLLVLPLYPQYSATTTAAAFDALARALSRRPWLPELRFVRHYHDHPQYIAALAATVREHQAAHGVPDRLLMSFHGIPQRYFLSGDPYHCECHKTARLLAEALELDESRYQLTFQSRFGREPWLQPYTDETLARLAREGVEHVQVICPGFAADCLETLEEIAIMNREAFVAAGGTEFSYIPALNDRADHVEALTALVLHHASGWRELDEGYDPDAARAEAGKTADRARSAGAPR